LAAPLHARRHTAAPAAAAPAGSAALYATTNYHELSHVARGHVASTNEEKEKKSAEKLPRQLRLFWCTFAGKFLAKFLPRVNF
jgi:hypothetical protein